LGHTENIFRQFIDSTQFMIERDVTECFEIFKYLNLVVSCVCSKI